LFIHTNCIKLNSSTCFKRNPLIIRRSTTQIIHMPPLVSSFSASDRLVQPLRKDLTTENCLHDRTQKFMHNCWCRTRKTFDSYWLLQCSWCVHSTFLHIYSKTHAGKSSWWSSYRIPIFFYRQRMGQRIDISSTVADIYWKISSSCNQKCSISALRL